MYDPLRKKNIADTPEEGVRQAIIHWLNTEKGYAYARMSSEYSFNFNGLSYRADIVVFDNYLKPIMLVECKAPSVKIDMKVVEQGLRYNRVLEVKYMLFTNGKSLYICRRKNISSDFEFIKEVPSYKELLEGNN